MDSSMSSIYEVRASMIQSPYVPPLSTAASQTKPSTHELLEGISDPNLDNHMSLIIIKKKE
jgi:hypothetical protein